MNSLCVVVISHKHAVNIWGLQVTHSIYQEVDDDAYDVQKYANSKFGVHFETVSKTRVDDKFFKRDEYHTIYGRKGQNRRH